MIKLVPEQHRLDLSMAIAKGEFDNVKKIIEENTIDVDSYIDTEFYTPIIMEVLLSYGIKDEAERLIMLRYFLEKGADANKNCKSGYNCLHVAVQQDKLIKALDLFLDFNGDVNLTDSNGATVAYWAIQSFPWRKEGEERQVHLNVVEKILMLGADLDHKNKFGVTPRKWLEHTSEDVKQLVEKSERLKPVHKPSRTLQPEFPTNLQYPEIAKKIWNELVPPIGQADTIQGELLRAIEKLRDEAQRNGNINFNKNCHGILIDYLRQNLVDENIFEKETTTEINADLDKLSKKNSPYTDDDIYDRITNRIVDWYLKNPKQIAHKKNDKLYC